MKKILKKELKTLRSYYYAHSLLFIPLIIMGGRLVFRVVMNLWDMIEP